VEKIFWIDGVKNEKYYIEKRIKKYHIYNKKKEG